MKYLYIDLDETLIPFDSFPRFLISFLPTQKIKSLSFTCQLPWLSLPANRPHLRPQFAKLLTHQKIQPIEDWCHLWVEKHLYPHVRRQLIKPSVPFSLCSLSLDLVVNPLSHLLGGGSLSTNLQRQNDCFTGFLDGVQCAGIGKAQKIQDDALNRQLALKDCGLMTDHHRDIPALEIVGHPILVNPTKKLLIWSQDKNIEVISTP